MKIHVVAPVAYDVFGRKIEGHELPAHGLYEMELGETLIRGAVFEEFYVSKR